jgi:hypothetical protein
MTEVGLKSEGNVNLSTSETKIKCSLTIGEFRIPALSHGVRDQICGNTDELIGNSIIHAL